MHVCMRSVSTVNHKTFCSTGYCVHFSRIHGGRAHGPSCVCCTHTWNIVCCTHHCMHMDHCVCAVHIIVCTWTIVCVLYTLYAHGTLCVCCIHHCMHMEHCVWGVHKCIFMFAYMHSAFICMYVYTYVCVRVCVCFIFPCVFAHRHPT